jgi:hypothetical protein
MNILLTTILPSFSVSLEWHMDYCAKNIDRNQSRERGFFD